MLSILGYTNPLSVAPGEELSVKVSSESQALTYRADLLRLYCGDDDPRGPGFRAVEIDSPINGEYPARHQPAFAGSYVRFPPTQKLEDIQSFTALVLIWPTTPGKGEQALISCWSARENRGFGVFIGVHGGVELRIGDGEASAACLACDKPLIEREWALVVATFDAATGKAHLSQRVLEPNPVRDSTVTIHMTLTSRANCRGLPLLLGACSDVADGSSASHYFNGKFERPRLTHLSLDETHWDLLLATPLDLSSVDSLVGAWDFSRDIETTHIHDLSPNEYHGETVNLPTRGVTSSEWSSEFQSPTEKPGHYAAVHLHDDDLYDVGWQTDFVMSVPDTLASGVYAVRLRNGQGEDYVPFFVRPRLGGPKQRVAFLASTATYLAYANNHAAYNEIHEELQWGTLTEVHPTDVYLSGNPGLGVSLYDSHADGTPVFYSSRHRPILTMRPLSRLWNFCADLHIIDWLDTQGYAVDVITDEDLDAEGATLLDDYQVLMTGTHPEYWSRPMLDALEQFKSVGGRLMYLGGNGFYWRVTFNKMLPGALECRKSEGVRLLDPAPGERHHSFDGKLGGLWRHLGRAPQTIAGVGTSAFGFADCGFYRRCPESLDPRAAFIFDGIEDEFIGDFGVTGGAVGFEIDRTDRALGTPAHCLVLAVSEPLSRFYVPAPEEAPFLHPAMTGDENGQVRSEMVFYEGPNGGAVFSTGSITWAASLSHDDYDNNVSRITKNVLERFLDPEAFSQCSR